MSGSCVSVFWVSVDAVELVELGGPLPRFDLDTRTMVWADLAPRLYAQAAAAQ
jgi:hypothetical protein